MSIFLSVKWGIIRALHSFLCSLDEVIHNESALTHHTKVNYMLLKMPQFSPYAKCCFCNGGGINEQANFLLNMLDSNFTQTKFLRKKKKVTLYFHKDHAFGVQL